MIKVFKILPILLVISGPAGAFYSTHMEWREHQCAICGKTIYVGVEAHDGAYMPMVTSDGFYSMPPGERATDFDFPEHTICQGCKDKYQPGFYKLIIDNVRYASEEKENAKSRKQYKERRRVDDLKEKEERINALEKEIKELKSQSRKSEKTGARIDIGTDNTTIAADSIVFDGTFMTGTDVLAAGNDFFNTGQCVKTDDFKGVIISRIITQGAFSEEPGKQWVIVKTKGGDRTAWLDDMESCPCSEALKGFPSETCVAIADWLDGGPCPFDSLGPE